MNLPFFIAGRYLIAKKSHNVINIISAISAVGMAIGTAALIIILSVYNGFDSLVKSMLANVDADLLITPARGKVFIPEGGAYDWLYGQERVKSICTVLEENVFVNYDSKQSVAKLKGVDDIYEEESPLVNYLRDGEFRLHRGDVPMACVGAGLAHTLGLNPRFVSPLEFYFPSRTKKISLANPVSSIEYAKAFPSGVFSVSNNIDAETVVVPISLVRELLGYEDEVSAVEIRMVDGTSKKSIEKIRKELAGRLGPDFKVSNQFEQNESLYKMMRYEKVTIYLILIFVIIIIAFNIFSSLSMLIIEKKEDIETFRSMGATDSMISRIFVLEGWLISLSGLAAGLLFGVLFALLQQQFGFIKMPGNFIVRAYPIILSWTDILFTSAGVASVGYIIANIPVMMSSRTGKRQSTSRQAE